MGKNGIVAGANTGKLEEFRAAQRVDPVALGLKADALWEGEMGRATVHLGPYSLNGDHIDRPTRNYTTAFGAWKEVEQAVGTIGPTDRQEPVEMASEAKVHVLARPPPPSTIHAFMRTPVDDDRRSQPLQTSTSAGAAAPPASIWQSSTAPGLLLTDPRPEIFLHCHADAGGITIRSRPYDRLPCLSAAGGGVTTASSNSHSTPCAQCAGVSSTILPVFFRQRLPTG